MKKIAFIIPGYNCSEKRKEYQLIAGFFKVHGIEPVLVRIDWKRKTFKDYLDQFMDCYNKHVEKNDEAFILGFSFGAMTACIASAEIRPKVQILCSLSPFFREDLPTVKQWWIRYWGKRRQEEFKNLAFTEISKKTKCKTYIIAGTKEGPEVEKRARDAYKKIAKSELIFLEGVKHDISNRRYLLEIENIISKL